MSGKSPENHYLTLVIPSLRKTPDALVFRPYLGRNDEWACVTYRELEQRLAVTRTHWYHTLATLNLNALDVVGLWLTGRKWTDLLNNIAISSLVYTPQLFNNYDFTNIAIIYELLAQSNAKALVVYRSHLSMLSAQDLQSSPIPQFAPMEDEDMLRAISELKADGDPELTFGMECRAAVSRDDIAVLFHSSGTTGGMPKVIPGTYKMLQAVVTHKLVTADLPDRAGQQHVIRACRPATEASLAKKLKVIYRTLQPRVIDEWSSLTFVVHRARLSAHTTLTLMNGRRHSGQAKTSVELTQTRQHLLPYHGMIPHTTSPKRCTPIHSAVRLLGTAYCDKRSVGT